MHRGKRADVIGMAMGADIRCNLQFVFLQRLKNQPFVMTGIKDQRLPGFVPDDVAVFLKGPVGIAVSVIGYSPAGSA